MCRSIKTLFNFEPPATKNRELEAEKARARSSALALRQS